MTSQSQIQAASLAIQQKGTQSSTTITRPDNTTAYTAGDVIGTAEASNLTLSDVSAYAGSNFIITGATLRIDINAVPAGLAGFRLHLYSSAPTAIADNTAYNLPAADRAKYIGYISISTPLDLGDTIFAQDDNINFNGKLASGGNDIYGILETIGSFTPSAEDVFTVILYCLGV